MIKNNLNIAQVNCSGISSSLFLLFDSKILCAGYLLRESHLRWGGQDPQALPFVVFTTAEDKGTPSGTTFSSPTSPAKYCTATWQFPLPTKPFRIKKEKQNKGNDQPSLSQPSKLGEVQGRRGGSQCLLGHCHKSNGFKITNPCVFRIRLTFWKVQKKSS